MMSALASMHALLPGCHGQAARHACYVSDSRVSRSMRCSPLPTAAEWADVLRSPGNELGLGKASETAHQE
jgi:hypothetical protein